MKPNACAHARLVAAEVWSLDLRFGTDKSDWLKYWYDWSKGTRISTQSEPSDRIVFTVEHVHEYEDESLR